ncbi:hypothetical protein [Microvirga makkahensis]|nr:hypothetical protein [Microvirga makkahensis]
MPSFSAHPWQVPWIVRDGAAPRVRRRESSPGGIQVDPGLAEGGIDPALAGPVRIESGRSPEGVAVTAVLFRSR